MDDLTLAAEFPPATREQWLTLVETVLKGADFDKKLVSRTYDGLRIEPLYPKAEAAPPVARAAGTVADRAAGRSSRAEDGERTRARRPRGRSGRLGLRLRRRAVRARVRRRDPKRSKTSTERSRA